MGFLEQHGLSQRRGCALLSINRSSCRYEARPRLGEDSLAARLRQIALEHPRYGYRRAWALLRREGLKVNHKRVERVWRREKLNVPRRKKRKRLKREAAPALRAEHPGQVWAYDFVQDQTEEGRKLRILTVTDEFTRRSVGITVARRMPACAVIEALEGLMKTESAPEFIRSDNGPEFIAQALKRWLAQRRIQTHYTDPGSPWQNAFEESFHDKLRQECLNMEVFATVDHARVVIEQWRRHYNHDRPHSSLGYLAPEEFSKLWKEKQQRDQRKKMEEERLESGALPPNPRSLSLDGHPHDRVMMKEHNSRGAEPTPIRPAPCGMPPLSALGSLSSGALSSGRDEQGYHIGVNGNHPPLREVNSSAEH